MSDRRPDKGSRVMPADSVASAKPWSFGDLADGESAGAPSPQGKAERDAAYQKGLQEGLTRGTTIGIQQGREQQEQEIRQAAVEIGGVAVDRMQKLVAGFDEDFRRMEQQLADQLVELSIEIARKLVGRAVENDRRVVLALVQECLASIGDSVSDTRIHLNPADLAVIESAVEAGQIDADVKLIADRQIEVGGCRVASPFAVLESTMASRWERLLADLGKGE